MDLRSLDLNLLVVFDRLMEARSVTGAARMLDLRQSSVSAALNRLRRTMQDRLLERQGNSMVPTRTALSVWPEIRVAINAIESSLAQLESFDAGRQTGTFRIGFDEYAFIVLGRPLLQSLRMSARQLGIDVLPIRPPTSDDPLNEGAVDVVIGASWTPLSGLRMEPLFTEDFVCLVDIDHPTIDRSLSLPAYLAVPHLLVSSIGQVPGNVDAVLTRMGRQRLVGITVPYLLAAPQLLAGSDMIFNTGRRLARLFSAWYPVRLVEPPIRIPNFTIAMIWHPRNSQSRAHQWLRDQVLTATRGVG